MKTNLLHTLLAITLLTSCKRNVTPIEKYGGSKYVIAEMDLHYSDMIKLQLKNKDSIFWVSVLHFDADSLKVGDTIR